LFIDSRTVPNQKKIETDICIIGAGAAGITIARELSKADLNVCFLESGGFEWDSETQALYKGMNIGDPYYDLDVSRLRYFGGTTNHWGGLCRPLDEIDFNARPWVADSGWPFSKRELEPYYIKAQEVCELGPYAYEYSDWATQEPPPIPFKGHRLVTRLFQNSPPTRFGMTYRSEIKRAQNVQTYLYANVTEFEMDDSGKTVKSAHVATLSGNKFLVEAKSFVVASGGIENPRLLLLSNKVNPKGLGNDYDLVGRYFADHPIMLSGSMIVNHARFGHKLYERHKINGVPLHGFITLSPEALERESMLNCGIMIKMLNWSENSPSVSSLKHILDSVSKGGVPDNLGKHLSNVIWDIDGISENIYGRGMDYRPASVNYWAEPEPNRDSRVSLGTEKDALGKRQLIMNWQLTERDKQNMTRMHQIVAEELGRAGLGRLKVHEDAWDHNKNGSYHHMGTTRMHMDPAKGVVGSDCRVHGVANLFVSGSSVFPTYGHANPTLTIVALAIRLADHLKKEIKK